MWKRKEKLLKTYSLVCLREKSDMKYCLDWIIDLMKYINNMLMIDKSKFLKWFLSKPYIASIKWNQTKSDASFFYKKDFKSKETFKEFAWILFPWIIQSHRFTYTAMNDDALNINW